ncbi:MAG: SpoIIE family protein phosphatase [Planctomycetales bacterium]
MTKDASKLPAPVVWTVVALCALPWLFNLGGLYFEARIERVPAEALGRSADDVPHLAETGDSILDEKKGLAIHTILEWTAFCTALFTAVFAFAHYHIKGDVATPVLGTALLFAGAFDAFRTLAADGLIATHHPNEQFLPFTWAVSRTFNVLIIIAGTLPFLRNGEQGPRRTKRGIPFLVLISVLFAIAAYSMIHVLATVPQLPQAIFLERFVPRPWDALPLVLYLVAGGVILPRFHRLHPSLFSHGLWVSILPMMVGQLHAAFGSRVVFANHYNISLYLKIVAYLVPLAGLILDYTRAYRTEVQLRTTQEKLKVARDVQQGLLPQSAPNIPGLDVAGKSHSAEAVGGDYFDYLPMGGGALGVVVADVSGHELGASILLAQTRAYLRALADADGDVSRVVSRLNEFLCVDVQSRWFVTLFLARVDAEARLIRFASAGHEAYLFEASGTLRKLECTSPPLGVTADQSVPCGPELSFPPGDILLVLTDGVTEATSASGEQFGIDRVAAYVRAHRGHSARDIAEGLFAAVDDYCGHAPHKDDRTAVIVKSLAHP